MPYLNPTDDWLLATAETGDMTGWDRNTVRRWRNYYPSQIRQLNIQIRILLRKKKKLKETVRKMDEIWKYVFPPIEQGDDP